MLTANCQNCGSPKDPAYYSAVVCPTCSSNSNEIAEHARKETNDAIAAETDPERKAHMEASADNYVESKRKEALMARAHYAHRNFVDPRDFNATGMIPRPPQSGDRGGPA